MHHEADVWLDGRLLGHHTGAYLPFEFSLRLRAGVPHRLVVRADFRYPSRQKRTGWHRTWFNYGGINREVTLRPLRDSELDAPTLRTRLLAGTRKAVVDVSVLVRNRAASARDLPVRGTLRRDGTGPEVRFPTVHLGPAEQRRVSARLVVDRPALWAPGSPNLYNLHLEVPGESAWEDRVGLRELRRDGGRVLLNGRRLRLHGASLHEDVPGRGDALLPADMDASSASCTRSAPTATRAQHAPVAAAARAPGRRGDPRLAGRRPGRRARRLDVGRRRARPRRPRARPRDRAPGADASVGHRLEPRQRGRRQRPRRSARSPTCATWRASCTARTRAAWSPSTSGARTRRRSRDSCTATWTRSR